MSLTIQGRCPAALRESTSFPVLPTPDIISLASTNLVGEKWNLINFSLIRSEVERYTGHILSASLYLLASLASQVATKGPHTCLWFSLPEPSSCLLRNTGLHSSCQCRPAYQLCDSSCRLLDGERPHHRHRVLLLSGYWKSWMSQHGGVKHYQTFHSREPDDRDPGKHISSPPSLPQPIVRYNIYAQAVLKITHAASYTDTPFNSSLLAFCTAPPPYLPHLHSPS